MNSLESTKQFHIDQMISLSGEGEIGFSVSAISLNRNCVLCESEYYVEPISKVFLTLSFELQGNHCEVELKGMVWRVDRAGATYFLTIRLLEVPREAQEKIEKLILLGVHPQLDEMSKVPVRDSIPIRRMS